MKVSASVILTESDLDLIVIALGRSGGVNGQDVRRKLKRLTDCPRRAPGVFELVEVAKVFSRGDDSTFKE